MYCSKCGRPISKSDKFCASCGAPTANSVKEIKKEKSEKSEKQRFLPSEASTSQKVGESVAGQDETKAVKAVRHVYYDKDGNQVKNPNVKTNSEAAMQGIMVACIAIAVIIVTIAGSMFISGNLLGGTFSDKTFSPSVSDVTSEENTKTTLPSDNAANFESSDYAQTSEVSSDMVSSIPDELLAVNMKRRLVGEWETNLPYKSMSMPATFKFDENGRCICTIKALFISQKFEGTYKVEDGGKCLITLNGIEEYMNGNNTMSGNARFVSDDELEFTSNGIVWNLKRK